MTPHYRIIIVTYAPRGSRVGNRVTALRWAKFLRQAGHHVSIIGSTLPLPELKAQCPIDAIVFLHARRCLAAQQAMLASDDPRWRQASWIVALTGTDIYGDWPNSQDIEFAHQHYNGLIALQDDMRAQLPATLREHCAVIYQSATPPLEAQPRWPRWTALISGHLRRVKAPFTLVSAVHRFLPDADLAIRQCGGELEPGLAAQARDWQTREPRYVYLGELSRRRAAVELQRADVLVNASEQEGGPAIVTEAIVAGVPVLASDIAAHRALLGEHYPALFAPHDEQALAALLSRARTDLTWYQALRAQIKQRAHLFSASHEARQLAHCIATGLAHHQQNKSRS